MINFDNYRNVSGATTVGTYPFDSPADSVCLMIAEVTQLVPQYKMDDLFTMPSDADITGYAAEKTFISRLTVGGAAADDWCFSAGDLGEAFDGAFFEYTINGDAKRFVLPDDVVAKMSSDNNLPIRTIK